MSRESSVTGVSAFYQLYDLCGFDPVKGLVVDALHALTLNLIRSEVEKHLLAELGPNATFSVLNRDTASVLDRRTLSKELDQVP